MDHLDKTHPMGDPTSTTCRQCRNAKHSVADALFCRLCDGAALRTAAHNHGY